MYPEQGHRGSIKYFALVRETGLIIKARLLSKSYFPLLEETTLHFFCMNTSRV
jgi:hypothetical protein